MRCRYCGYYTTLRHYQYMLRMGLGIICKARTSGRICEYITEEYVVDKVLEKYGVSL